MTGAPANQHLAWARERFAEVLGDALARSGYRLPDIRATMLQHAGRAFDDLAGLRSKAEFTRLRGLTASRISLVHPEDMDLTVRLINLAQSLNDSSEQSLARLHLQFMTLLDQSSAAPEQLPVGPEAICAALRSLLDGDAIAPELRAELPSQIERPLLEALPGFYAELVDGLRERGVEGRSLLRSGNDSRAMQGEAGQGGGYQGDMRGSVLSDARRADGPLIRLQQRALQQRGAPAGAAPALDPALLAAIMEQVFAWLATQQQEAASQPASPGAGARLGELGALLPPERNATLDAINASFDALLADAQLCASIKPALERLRLPVIKAALQAPGCLDEPAHPVPRLLEVVLRLARSLPLQADAGHPLCKALSDATLGLQRDFGAHFGLFEEAGMHLEVLEQSRITALTEHAMQLLPLADREMRREHSRNRAARAIRALCAAEPPVPVRDFLEQVWVRVLAAIHQRGGEKCTPWFAALGTANKLLESVQPRHDAESRRQLAASIPALLAELRAGLDAVGTPDNLREIAFNNFAVLHTAALRGQKAAPTEYPPLLVASAARVETVADIPGLHVVRLAPEGEPEADEPAWVAALNPGDWFSLAGDGLGHAGDRFPLRLVWSGGSPRMLLAATADELTLIAPLRWLLGEARAGRATPLPMEALFDQAAAAALAQGL